MIYNCVSFGIDEEELVDVLGKLGYEPWVSKVPQGWETKRLKELFAHSSTGATPTSSESIWYENGTIPWLRIGDFKNSYVTSAEKYITSDAVTRFKLEIHSPGTLLISTYATVGKPAILQIPATTNQAILALNSPQGVIPKFIYYWMMAYKEELKRYYSRSTTQANVNQTILHDLRISVPDLKTQDNIVQKLDLVCSSLDNSIALITKSIEILDERKHAVVTHAISGKLTF